MLANTLLPLVSLLSLTSALSIPASSQHRRRNDAPDALLPYPRNHTDSTCPILPGSLPSFGIISTPNDPVPSPTPASGYGPPSAQPTGQYPNWPKDNALDWNILSAYPVSGGASNSLSHFQGPLAPDAPSCLRIGHATFNQPVDAPLTGGNRTVVTTTGVQLLANVPYTLSYRFWQGNGRVGHVGMHLTSGAWIWTQCDIKQNGTMGGVDFILRSDQEVQFDVEIVQHNGNARGGIGLFELGQ